jgi:Zn-dependent metalloprotease
LAVLLVAATTVIPAQAQKAPRIVRGRSTAAPRFVLDIAAKSRAGRPAEIALDHLAHPRYRISSPGRELDPIEVDPGSTTTVRFQQIHRTVPVWGANYLVHLDRNGDEYAPRSVNGHFFTDLNVRARPSISVRSAQKIVRLRAAIVAVRDIISHGLTVLPLHEGVLTHHFTLRGTRFGTPLSQEVFVNAHSGEIVMTYSSIHPDGPVTASGSTSHGESVTFGAYQRGTKYELRDQSKQMFVTSGGEITTHDALGTDDYLATLGNIVESSESTFSGPDTLSGAVDAHYGSARVYDFYLSLGRNSVDGQGGDIVSTVNATEGGRPMYNAFWDGITEQMVYGNPNPAQVHPFSAELDIVGHELTHGVTQHTGNLAYLGQPGAMNEAYSDYFGNAIDVTVSATPMTAPEAGYIGEGLCKPGSIVIVCPIRDLNDGTTTEDYIYYLADFDFGGVHLNSTIYSGALWDIRETLGADADRYIYRALEAYTTPLDSFIDGRNSILAAANELGAPQEHRNAIDSAFETRGILPGWDTATTNDSAILMSTVAPVNAFFETSEPRVWRDSFVISDYEDKSQMCCTGLQVMRGSVTSGTPENISGFASANLSHDSPDISGRRVVWSLNRIGDAGIFDADIVLKTGDGLVKKIAGPGILMNPEIDGRLVAWESRGGNIDVEARYLGRRKITVAGGRGDQLMPTVSGDWVSWWDLSGRLPKIRVKNLATGRRRTFKPPGSATIYGPPALNRRYVFWYRDLGFDGIGSIVRANLANGQERVLVNEQHPDAPVWGFATPLPPVVATNDSLIVYASERDYAFEFVDPDSVDNDEVGRDLFLVSVNGGDPVSVTSNRGDQGYPALGFGRRVVWLDSSQGQTHLMTRVVP